MIYLYYITAARRLERVLDKQGNHVCGETKAAASEKACYWSSYTGYQICLERNANLHGTVKSFDYYAESSMPVYRTVEPHAYGYEAMPTVPVAPWYRRWTKAIGKYIRSFWVWC